VPTASAAVIADETSVTTTGAMDPVGRDDDKAWM
jgi:hypothetical protein